MGRSVVAAAKAADPDAADPLDRVSSRPDYLVMVYGAGTSDAGRAAEEFSADISYCGRGGSRSGERLRAAFHGYEPRGRGGRNSSLSKGPARIRRRLREPGVFSTGWTRCGIFCNWAGSFPKANRHARIFPERGFATLAIPFAAMIAVQTLQPAALPVVNDGYGELVYVPAGAFKMGDNFGDGEPRERPVHLVELDAYLHRQVRDDQRPVAQVSR